MRGPDDQAHDEAESDLLVRFRRLATPDRTAAPDIGLEASLARGGPGRPGRNAKSPASAGLSGQGLVFPPARRWWAVQGSNL